MLDNAGTDGNMKGIGLEYDTSRLGVKGLVLALSKIYLQSNVKTKASALYMGHLPQKFKNIN